VPGSARRDLCFCANAINGKWARLFSGSPRFSRNRALLTVGKETVPEILMCRFSHSGQVLLESRLLNRSLGARTADHIAEMVRASKCPGGLCYDRIVRLPGDMVAEPLLQPCLCKSSAMEPPANIEADTMRDEEVLTGWRALAADRRRRTWPPRIVARRIAYLPTSRASPHKPVPRV